MSFDVAKWNKKRYLTEAGITEADIVGDRSIYDQCLDIVIDYLREANGDDAAAYLERMRSFITNTMVAKVQEGQTVHEGNYNMEESEGNLGDMFAKEFKVKVYSSGDSISFTSSEDISDKTFEKMIKFVKDKGYTVDRAKSTNYYDDDGEKKIRPQIKFSKK